jgi:hypothetical protein
MFTSTAYIIISRQTVKIHCNETYHERMSEKHLHDKEPIHVIRRVIITTTY